MFFQNKTNLEIQGVVQQNLIDYQCYVGTFFRSQYCKDPKIKESGVFKCLPMFPPFVGGQIMISDVFNASFSQVSSRPRLLVKDPSKWWWLSKGIWRPKMPKEQKINIPEV